MTKLKLYNTLTRKKEIFKPVKGKVRIYSCGPTVYWYQHIGNMRYAIFVDILKRVLLYNNYKIKHVMNITDVGHLTSDADEGEDKMVKAIKREGLALNKKSMLKIADKYARIFMKDLKKLNIILPDKMPKATEHIKDMIEVIKKIDEKGYAYKTSVGLIFDTSKFKDYSKFAKLKTEDLKKGARVQIDKERKNPSDFALWITNQPNHIMLWDSPWGRGFPGWHIECTAMSSKYLGEQFDIHTGGEEHISVHHTNEIAQSEAAFGKSPWVKYWLHVRWLRLKKGKMSKSLGNVYTISELEEKDYNALDFRYLALLTHYRKPLTFDFNALNNAKNAYEKLKNIIQDIKQDNKTNKEYLEKFEKAINDDLNTPKALSVIWEFVRDKNAQGKINTIKKMDEVLGLELFSSKREKQEIPKEIREIAEKRQEARKNKNFELADKLRKGIRNKGYEIDDTSKGQKIRKI